MKVTIFILLIFIFFACPKKEEKKDVLKIEDKITTIEDLNKIEDKVKSIEDLGKIEDKDKGEDTKKSTCGNGIIEDGEDCEGNCKEVCVHGRNCVNGYFKDCKCLFKKDITEVKDGDGCCLAPKGWDNDCIKWEVDFRDFIDEGYKKEWDTDYSDYTDVSGKSLVVSDDEIIYIGVTFPTEQKYKGYFPDFEHHIYGFDEEGKKVKDILDGINEALMLGENNKIFSKVNGYVYDESSCQISQISRVEQYARKQTILGKNNRVYSFGWDKWKDPEKCKLFAFDFNTCSYIWDLPMEDEYCNLSYSIVLKDQTIILVLLENFIEPKEAKIIAIKDDGKKGNIYWTKNVFSGRMIVDGEDNMYFCVKGQKFNILTKDGNLIDIPKLNEKYECFGFVVMMNEEISLVSVKDKSTQEYKMIIFDVKKMEVKNYFKNNYDLLPAVDANGNIYAKKGIPNEYHNGNEFYILSSKGEILWKITIPPSSPPHPELGPLGGSNPVRISKKGMVYVASGYKLFAIYSGASGPADSPWPQFGHDAKNTHNAGM